MLQTHQLGKKRGRGLCLLGAYGRARVAQTEPAVKVLCVCRLREGRSLGSSFCCPGAWVKKRTGRKDRLDWRIERETD